VIGERPSKWALIGGAIIVGAVVVHTTLKAKAGRKLLTGALQGTNDSSE
jgi:drug/metabolite transporter (DMT)-like permease